MNKGKQGEGQMAVLFGNMQQVEEKFEFTKPSFTNAPDNGLDFELRAPHNIGEKFDAIICDKDRIPVSSNTQIKIRVDNKNYDGKISKPIAVKFVNDCKKNPNDAEHWLTGGKGLTCGAQEIFASTKEVCRYYSQEELDKVNQYYQAQVDCRIYVDDVLREKEKIEISIRDKKQ